MTRYPLSSVSPLTPRELVITIMRLVELVLCLTWQLGRSDQSKPLKSLPCHVCKLDGRDRKDGERMIWVPAQGQIYSKAKRSMEVRSNRRRIRIRNQQPTPPYVWYSGKRLITAIAKFPPLTTISTCVRSSVRRKNENSLGLQRNWSRWLARRPREHHIFLPRSSEIWTPGRSIILELQPILEGSLGVPTRRFCPKPTHLTTLVAGGLKASCLMLTILDFFSETLRGRVPQPHTHSHLTNHKSDIFLAENHRWIGVLKTHRPTTWFLGLGWNLRTYHHNLSLIWSKCT